jgi:hypothetical protein
MHDSARTNARSMLRALACALISLATQSPTQAAAADSAAAGKGNAVVRGDDLCGLLGPGDFDAAGVKGARPPRTNNSPPTDYYCTYAGMSGYKGGIEFDAFLADSARDAARTFKTVTKETAGRDAVDRAKALGVDEALLSLQSPGDPGPVATLSVRQGKLVFAISFPSNSQAEAQLLALARTVLQRGDKLTQ